MGRYKILYKLATGGMAEVFLARQEGPQGFSKQVVIKKLLPHLAEHRQFVEMFLHEARVAAMMSHPNVVSVYELGEDVVGGNYYIAMEYLNGRNLLDLQHTYTERHGRPLPAVLCARIVSDACAGLEFAHNLLGPDGKPLHLIHRDISPDNIFLTAAGCVKVLDFGIAKANAVEGLTEAGQVKGKFGYTPPEQIEGRPLDRRADIWSLGATLYWLCSGARPFHASNDAEILRKVLDAAPPPLDPAKVPEGLQRIIFKALSKNPAQRQTSARGLQHELEQWVANATPSTRLSASDLGDLMQREYPDLVTATSTGLAAPAPVPLKVTLPRARPADVVNEAVTDRQLESVIAPGPSPTPSRALRILCWLIEVALTLVVFRFTYLAMPSAAFTALLFVSVASLSARSASPAQLLFGLRLGTLDGKEAPLPRSLLRFVVQYGWLLAFSIFVGLAYSGARVAAAFGGVSLAWGALVLIGALWGLGRRGRTLHDKISGLEVLRRIKT